MKYFAYFYRTYLWVNAMVISALIVIASLQNASACYDEPDCSLPPEDAEVWSTGTAPGGTPGATFDQIWVTEWQYNIDHINNMLSGLEIYECDWDEGWGFPEVWDLDKPLSRLLNAAWIVVVVEDYAGQQGRGLWRTVSGIPEDKFTKGFWWDFIAAYGEDEWEPSCEDKWATHVRGVDEYNTLHLRCSYKYSAANRASTLVHETTHQDVRHQDEYACIPASESCDYKYGEYNANTMQLNFLHDAIVTYRTAPSTYGGLVKQVAVDGDTCRFLPRFAPDERVQMYDKGNGVMDRFYTGPAGGWKFALSAEINTIMANETWPCGCDPDKYVFDPNVCEQSACNEMLNPANVGVNSSNRDNCNQYNTSLSQAETELDVATARDIWIGNLEYCKGPDKDLAIAYCQDQIALAGHLSEIDNCGLLEGIITPGVISKHNCVQLYCKQKFQETGGVNWETDDPFGCLDYFCGGEQCGNAYSKELCVFEFMMAQGDPAGYVANCELSGCKRVLLDCLRPFYQNGSWTYGDEIPPSCQWELMKCKTMSKFAGMIYLNLKFFDDLGPLRDLTEGLYSNGPARSFYAYIDMIKQAASDGHSDAVAEMFLAFVSSPERVAALYRAAPAKFVGLFGKQGFAEILGPEIERIEGEAIKMSELTPQGQAALKEFKRLLNQLPVGSQMKGAIGTFRR